MYISCSRCNTVDDDDYFLAMLFNRHSYFLAMYVFWHSEQFWKTWTFFGNFYSIFGNANIYNFWTKIEKANILWNFEQMFKSKNWFGDHLESSCVNFCAFDYLFSFFSVTFFFLKMAKFKNCSTYLKIGYFFQNIKFQIPLTS